MRVAFRVDASARIGGGHVMRCLTLADELRSRGATTVFVAAAIPQALAERVRADGHDLYVVVPLDELNRGGEDWDRHELSVEAQALDASRALDALGGQVEWLIVDHYLLGAPWHRATGGAAGQLMVIDDLANRLLDCDLLLDQTLGRCGDDYARLVADRTSVLIGPRYALLRPEFVRERPAALKRRRDPGPVNRILVSLGTTDVGGVTGQVLEAILPVTGDWAIDVVTGAQTPSFEQVRALAGANPHVTVHVDARNMAELMRDADLAIGAAGTTSWERCCMGLPAVVLVLAQNQARIGQALADAGAHRLTRQDDLPDTLAHALADPEMRRDMALAASAIVDGLGAARVAERLSGARRTRVA